jgi:hypothetical protein
MLVLPLDHLHVHKLTMLGPPNILRILILNQYQHPPSAQIITTKIIQSIYDHRQYTTHTLKIINIRDQFDNSQSTCHFNQHIPRAQYSPISIPTLHQLLKAPLPINSIISNYSSLQCTQFVVSIASQPPQ